MAAFLPDLHNLLGLAGVAAALALFLLLGAMTTAAGTLPEIQIVAGWGLTCLVLTAWTVLTPATAKIPLAGLALVALLALARPRWRARVGSLAGVGRLLLLSLPMWLVLLPLRPAEIDTWLNLLPNAAYLYDHGMLPTDARPPSYSFLPAAPYNTQFVAYIASVVSGSFADAAMALFNVALLCASGLLLARAIAGRGAALSWPACAMGLLLAIPLNPGFVPRVFFASYGEAPLAVTTMFAVWVAIDVVTDLARGTVWPRATTALALIMAALVNIKQSGVGELLSVGLPLLAVTLVHPRIPVRRGVVVVAAALLPALLLALAWRVFVEQAFVGGELKPLPFAAWNFGLLPTILGAMLRIAVQKATLFVLIAAALARCRLAVPAGSLEPARPPVRADRRGRRAVQRLPRRHLRRPLSGRDGRGRALLLPLCVAALAGGHTGADRGRTAVRGILADHSAGTCPLCRRCGDRAGSGDPTRHRGNAALRSRPAAAAAMGPRPPGGGGNPAR